MNSFFRFAEIFLIKIKNSEKTISLSPTTTYESYFAELENSLDPQPAQIKVPLRFSLFKGLVNGLSVPCCRKT